jgi:hypothetical protein
MQSYTYSVTKSWGLQTRQHESQWYEKIGENATLKRFVFHSTIPHLSIILNEITATLWIIKTS